MSSATYYALSAYYSEMHDDAAMLACMEKAAELSPDNYTYLERLGQVYIKTHDYGKATEVYERLADNNPGRTDVLGILMQLYENENSYDKVIATLDRIETIEGSNVRIKIEPGTQPGKTLRLRDKGLRPVQGYGNEKGDLIVNISVYVPQHLSHDEQRAIEAFKHSDNFKGDASVKQRIFQRFRNYFS